MTEQHTAQDIRKKLIDAAMRLASQEAWDDITLKHIATEAGLPLAACYGLFTHKSDILKAFTAHIDQQVLNTDFGFEEDETPRERLFEVLMTRFESMAPYRLALANILKGQSSHPLGWLSTAGRLDHSMGWMLEAAHISSDGFKGAIRRKGLLTLYLQVGRAWLRDDSEDMAATMKALDKALNQMEGWAERFENSGNWQNFWAEQVSRIRAKQRQRQQADTSQADESTPENPSGEATA